MTKKLFAVVGAALLLATGCSKGADSKYDAQPLHVVLDTGGTIHERFYVVTSALWPDPGNIPVCWQDAGFEDQKAWIKDAIHKSWELNDPSIKFTGWGMCTRGAPGIHIAARNDPDGPHTSDIGNFIDGMDDGMVLDLEMQGEGFENCLNDEMFEHCNRAVAIHEFGHALGLMHEQERQDTPSSCPDKDTSIPQESDMKTIGKWDLMSIMNYCYPDRLEVYPTTLSPQDIAGIRQVYPPPKAAPATPPSDGDATKPSTQSTGDVSEVGDEDDEPRSTGDDDDDDDSSKSTSKKSAAHHAPAPVASAGCSAAPHGSPSSNLSWLVGLGLVVAARRRKSSAA